MYIYLMLLSRNKFFLLLLVIFVAPIIAPKLIWLARSEKSWGIMCFTGHTLTSLGTSQHPVILFKAGRDSVFFNANTNFTFQTGERIPVRYLSSAPREARVDTPIGIWGDTMAWTMFPILVILVLYCTPEKFQPLIPRRTSIKLKTSPPFISFALSHNEEKNSAEGVVEEGLRGNCAGEKK